MLKNIALSLLLAASVVAAACGASNTGGIRPASAPAGGPMDDATITARVKTVLLNDTQVAGSTIDVATAGGIVTISGTVKSPSEASRAIELARSVTGVRDVKSVLQVTPES
jgi:hyperosmotically inducible periplasmic protein